MIKTAGKYKATLNSYGFNKSAEGKDYIELWFDVEGHGSIEKRLYLTTEKGIEIALKNLATLGLKKKLATVADGPLGGALDMKTAVELEIEMKANAKKPGKMYPDVKYINPIRGAKFDAALASQGKSKLENLEGSWLKLKQEKGIKDETTTTANLGF